MQLGFGDPLAVRLQPGVWTEAQRTAETENRLACAEGSGTGYA